MVKVSVGKARNLLEKIYQIGQTLEMEVYPVGGFVRDLYLGTPGHDIDFVVVGDAIRFAKEFRSAYKSGKVVQFPRFGTAMLKYRNWQLEFVSARAEHYQPKSRKPKVERAGLESDLSRRDFTINCLAMHIDPPRLGEVVDIFKGIDDLAAGIIRTPLDPEVTFSDDPLRILRAIRFAARFGFQIEPRTYEAIKSTRERLKIVSQERITEEFRKMLLADKPSGALSLLRQTGITPLIFPELDELAGVEQRQEYHHKDVFAHTLQVVDNISRKTDRFELRLTALMHDIAKPQTKRFVEEVGWTFHGHEELGARMVERIGRRMRLPLDTIKYVSKLVRLHMRPTQLVDEMVTDSAIRRLIVEAGEEIDDLLTLCRADITSKNPNKVRRFLANFDRVEKRIQEVEEKDELRRFKPALTGDDIMKILGIAPGPLVGQIKQRIVDAILDGDIPNQYEACYQYLLTIRKEFFTEDGEPIRTVAPDKSR